MTYLDLTHTFTQDMPLYPGDPKPKWEQAGFLEQDQNNSFQIQTKNHVGTHIDAPWHMLEGGKMLSEFPPEHFFGRGRLIDARDQKFIDANLLTGVEISSGDMVLILTGFGKKFRDPQYFESYPEITEAFAKRMVELGVKIVGMDTPSPDRSPYFIHKILLKNDILILENLTNLESLVGLKQFEVIALPPKFEADGAPVRVVASVP